MCAIFEFLVYKILSACFIILSLVISFHTHLQRELFSQICRPVVDSSIFYSPNTNTEEIGEAVAAIVVLEDPEASSCTTDSLSAAVKVNAPKESPRTRPTTLGDGEYQVNSFTILF